MPKMFQNSSWTFIYAIAGWEQVQNTARRADMICDIAVRLLERRFHSLIINEL